MSLLQKALEQIRTIKWQQVTLQSSSNIKEALVAKNITKILLDLESFVGKLVSEEELEKMTLKNQVLNEISNMSVYELAAHINPYDYQGDLNS